MFLSVLRQHAGGFLTPRDTQQSSFYERIIFLTD